MSGNRARHVYLDVLRGLSGLAVPMLHIQEGFCLVPSRRSMRERNLREEGGGAAVTAATGV